MPISLPCDKPDIVWFTTALNIPAAISSFLTPWFNRGWTSDLANTPQRDAILHIFSWWLDSSFNSSAVTFSKDAIWSINAPVPPAQLPFILISKPPVRNNILASSPPNSITVSVFG